MAHKKIPPLLRSARRGDLASLRALLAADNAPDQHDGDGNTPLSLACERGHREMVGVLLQHGAKPDFATSERKVPLAIAAFRGDIEMCDQLLAHGADIDRKSDGKTPLAHAIWSDHPALAAHLITLGANVDCPDDNESAPIVLAARGEHPELLARILENSRMAPQDPLFTQAMSEAAGAGHREAVTILLDHGCRPDFETPPTPCYFGFPLYEAARAGHAEIVSLLLARGARINESCDMGSALNTAAEHGRAGIIEILLAHHADVRQRDAYQRDALAWALEKERPDIARQLLQAGAQPGPQQLDATFLLIARTDDVALARRLLAHGASPLVQLGKAGIPHKLDGDINERISSFLAALKGDDEDDSDEGSTALMLAAEEGHPVMVEFLLETGLAVDARNRRGDTALINACFNARSEAVQTLLAAGADPRARNRFGWHCMHSAASSRNPEIVALLAAHGADVNSPDDEGWSPLIEALRENRPATARRLLALGAVLRPCDDGYTPLMAAARGECLEMLDELIARGEDIHARFDENNLDALMLAASNGLQSCVQRLLEHGANVHARNGDGETALQMAQAGGHAEVVALLMAAGADSVENARPTLDDAYYQRLIEQLQRCMPTLDTEAMFLPVAGDDVLGWLYDALHAQGLMHYLEWKEYWGDLPDLQAFDDIDLTNYSPQPLIDLMEKYGYPDWPNEIPYFEYQNHHLKEYGLRLLTFACENIHVMCVQDDAAEIDTLSSLLAAGGISLIVHESLDLGQCSQFLEQTNEEP